MELLQQVTSVKQARSNAQMQDQLLYAAQLQIRLPAAF